MQKLYYINLLLIWVFFILIFILYCYYQKGIKRLRKEYMQKFREILGPNNILNGMGDLFIINIFILQAIVPRWSRVYRYNDFDFERVPKEACRLLIKQFIYLVIILACFLVLYFLGQLFPVAGETRADPDKITIYAAIRGFFKVIF